jgi:hypothetical protein
MRFGPASATFNNGSVDYDLIVNGDTVASLLHVDASADFIGMGIAIPGRRLEILDATNPQLRLTQSDGSWETDFQQIAGSFAVYPGGDVFEIRPIPTGTAAQTLWVYRTYPNAAANYVRVGLSWNGNHARLGRIHDGSGAVGNLEFAVGGQAYWYIHQTSGAFCSQSDGLADIGIDDTTRPNNIYIKGNLFWASGVTGANMQAEFDHANDAERIYTFPNAGNDVSGVLFTQTASVATSSATETTLTGAGRGTLTLPANYFILGRSIRVKASGVYSSQAVPVTLNIRVKLGSTVICVTGDQTTAGAMSNRLWKLDCIITCRTTGGTGTVFGQSAWEHMATAGATGTPTWWEMSNTATTTIDTTGTLAVDVTADWAAGVGGADAISCTNLTVEAL